MNYLIPELKKLKVDKKFIGVPFLKSGTTLNGTDCCGLVWMFAQENGIQKPIISDDTQTIIKEFIRRGKIIKSTNDLQPLDIILFHYNNEIFHVGVYLGYGEVLHQNKNARSIISKLDSYLDKYFCCGIRPTELIHNNEELYNKVKDKDIEFIATAIGAIASVIAGAVAGALAIGGVSSLVIFGFVQTVVTGLLYVGLSLGISAIANALSPKPNFGMGGAAEGSPRYSFGPLQNTATSNLPIPIIYGEIKIAGNSIYQSDPGETVYRCDTLCEGEINSMSDIRINDVPISELTGCSVTTYSGTSSQTVDNRFSNRVPGLRNVANLALTLQTSDKLKGGFPVITSVVQGLKVETWDGINWPITKTFSDNPAACIRDFLTNTRYGIGLSKSLLDENSFGECYDYFNIMVSNNDGGTEKRYTINFVIDAKKPAVDILADMLSTCGSFLIWSGNKLKLRTEKVENVVQNFTMDNIVDGSFSYQYVSKDNMVNRVRLMYIDSTQNYTNVYALAEDKISQDELSNVEGGNGIIEREVAILGVTKFSRASRLANMFLRISKATPLTCKFKASIYAVHCEPGDVVTISHDVPNWTNKPFRIYGMEEEENDEITILAKEYNESLYDDSYGSGITLYQYGSPPNYLKNTSEITGLAIAEVGWRNEDGTHVANLDVSWNAPLATDFLTGYYIEWSKDGADYVFADRADIGSTSKRIPNATVGSTYAVRIKTVNYYGIYSSGATSGTILISGKDDNPPDIVNFKGNQFRDSLVFSWDKITSVPDISHHEIRKGASWSSGTPIGILIADNTWTYNNIQNGTATYWIKAVDRTGNYSTNAVSQSITVTSIPFQNIIITQNEHTTWSGTKNHTLASGDNLYIESGYLSGDYLTDWLDVGQEVTARIGYNFVVSTSGDLAWDSDASLTFDTYDNLRFSGFDVPQNIDFFVQTSGDSGPSGDFMAWQFSDYAFRYVRTKAVLKRDDVNQVSILNNLTTNIDVPDIDEYGPTDGSYLFVPASGMTVSLSKTYYYVPNVAIMVFPSGGTTRTPEVSATLTSFTVALRDNTNTATKGNIKYHVHGFVWLLTLIIPSIINILYI